MSSMAAAASRVANSFDKTTGALEARAVQGGESICDAPSDGRVAIAPPRTFAESFVVVFFTMRWRSIFPMAIGDERSTLPPYLAITYTLSRFCLIARASENTNNIFNIC